MLLAIIFNVVCAGAPDVSIRIQKIRETIDAVVKIQVSNQKALTVLDEELLNPANLRANMTNEERSFRCNLSQLLSSTNLYLFQLRSELDEHLKKITAVNFVQ